MARKVVSGDANIRSGCRDKRVLIYTDRTRAGSQESAFNVESPDPLLRTITELMQCGLGPSPACQKPSKP
ncbi:hypothetical protein AAHC03_04897 [Spirometra sp. Aus1]